MGRGEPSAGVLVGAADVDQVLGPDRAGPILSRHGRFATYSTNGALFDWGLDKLDDVLGRLCSTYTFGR